MLGDGARLARRKDGKKRSGKLSRKMEFETELFGGRSGGTKTKPFPFHFLPAPPTPPADFSVVRKWLVFCGDRREREARRVTTQAERTEKYKATTRSARAKINRFAIGFRKRFAQSEQSHREYKNEHLWCLFCTRGERASKLLCLRRDFERRNDAEGE